MGEPIHEMHELVVDANDPAVQQRGEAVAKVLLREVGIATALGILTVAMYEVLNVVMHSVTPMPEANIAACGRLIDGLKERVLDHSDCALRINGAKKQKVH